VELTKDQHPNNSTPQAGQQGYVRTCVSLSSVPQVGNMPSSLQSRVKICCNQVQEAIIIPTNLSRRRIPTDKTMIAGQQQVNYRS
jgi:hypothetical protein